jgi:hypothetical protein
LFFPVLGGRSCQFPGALMRVHGHMSERGHWTSVRLFVKESKSGRQKLVSRTNFLKERNGSLEFGCRSNWNQQSALREFCL